MPIFLMSDPIIVPLPVYYGEFDTRNGQAGFPKPAFLFSQQLNAEASARGNSPQLDQNRRLRVV